MVGSFTVFWGVSMQGYNPVLSVLLSVILCITLGVTIEFIAYRPLRGAASSLAVLITAIGVSYFLQNVALLLFGASAKTFTSMVPLGPVRLFDGQVVISGEAIVTIVACLIIMICLTMFIKKTKPGQAMLAVSEDKGAAQLMGINVNGTIALTFALGSGLAAIAGILLSSNFPSINPYTGSMPGIKAFIAAVFGGIGSVPGALIGGIILGVIEIFGRAYISSQMADAIVFMVLIVVLLVKPTGILGRKLQEKV
jgi:branched-chain amino acid transport system permease protein